MRLTDLAVCQEAVSLCELPAKTITHIFKKTVDVFFRFGMF